MILKNRHRINPFRKFINFALPLFFYSTTCLAQVGISWTSQTSPANNVWTSVTYGNSLFVAVANSGIGNRVMTSPDGVNWTLRSSTADNGWLAVTYGNGLFVAVASSGVNRVMTSPDGITWTGRTSADETKFWTAVTYGNGLFVAVAQGGVINAVMTSPDGINWTLRSSVSSNSWISVTYGNGLFVATSISGTGDRVMTSPNGITWTLRASAADNSWLGVTYANNLFVAVSNSASGDGVMTSPDGITWTTRIPAANIGWRSVCYGNNLFVAVSSSGIGNRVMTSPDGINWTSRVSAADNFWRSVCYGNGVFVAVSQNGTNNRVMTSGVFGTLPVQWLSFTAKNINDKHELRWQTASETNSLEFEIERSSDGIAFEKIGVVTAAVNTITRTEYLFTDNQPPAGISYYRLKQVDIDGRFEYSRIVAVNNRQAFSFYPNPARDEITITGLGEPGKQYRFTITNIAGQMVLSGVVPSNRVINIETLTKGAYYLSVNDYSRKLVKQ